MVLFGLLGCQAQSSPRYWQWAEDVYPASRAALARASAVSGLPNASGIASFNGGLAAFAGQTYLTVRIDRYGKALRRRPCRYERTVSMGVLDDAGELAGDLQPLSLPGETACDTAEDARLIACDGALYAVYSATLRGPSRRQKGIVRMYLAELDVSDSSHLRASWARRLAGPSAAGPAERNWTPFCHDGNLHFITQTVPHTVAALPKQELVQAMAQGGNVDIISPPLQLAALMPPPATEANIAWAGGKWRGGTPALYEPSLGEYVSFFHSHLDWGGHRLYYAGFYSFAAEPPFAIRRYIAQPVDLPAVTTRWHERSRIVFPMGLLDTGEQYLISYGQDDTGLGLAALDKAALFAQLTSLP